MKSKDGKSLKTKDANGKKMKWSDIKKEVAGKGAKNSKGKATSNY